MIPIYQLAIGILGRWFETTFFWGIDFFEARRMSFLALQSLAKLQDLVGCETQPFVGGYGGMGGKFVV